MTETDDHLLNRWIERRDPAAFAALAERHAGLAYATCRRITGDHHAAEDLAQDVLLELARGADRVRRSVAGFLHAAARTRALNHLRDTGTRRRHEAAAAREAATAIGGADDGTWRELEPRLDEALAELGEEERAALVLHYLEGRPQDEVAAILGLSQPTVSRRIAAGLDGLRTRLARLGIVLSLAALAELCAARAAEETPAAVTAAARRIGLAGAGEAPPRMPTTVSTMRLAAAAAVILIAALGAWWILDRDAETPSPSPGRPAAPASPVKPADLPDPDTPPGDAAVTAPDRPPHSIDAEAIAAGFRAADWPDHELLAVALAAAAAGIDLDYPLLMAVSGMAFRLQVLDYQPWCPSCFNGRYGFPAVDTLARELPSLTRLEAVPETERPGRIMASLAAGLPVPAQGDWWWGVVVAREDGPGRPWSVVGFDGRRRRGDLPDIGWLLPGAVEIDRSALARAAVARALELWRTPTWPGPREGSVYAGGEAAWRRWAELLRLDEAAFADLAEAHAEDRGTNECYRKNVRWLASARRTAAEACRTFTAFAPAGARPHLAEAAARYRAVHAALADGAPSRPRGNGTWPADARLEQAAVIDAARAEEAAAVAALAAALAAWE